MSITDTDKIVAAILAASQGSVRGLQEPNEYIASYQDFLELLQKNVAKTAERQAKDGSKDLKKVFPQT